LAQQQQAVSAGSVQSLPCNDLSAFPPAFDPSLVAAAASLMDYALGPTFACYVGCRYGVNAAAVDAYVRLYPDGAGGHEDPHNNVFWPMQARLMAATLCAACPTSPCAFNRYRPPPCGPPCALQPELCGDLFMDGCTGTCNGPPANAVTVGGATTPSAGGCPWTCNGGFHLTPAGDGCVSCSAPCDAGYVHNRTCPPYARSACIACAPIEGGIADLWVTTEADGGGRCSYRCVTGYYAEDPPLATTCRRCEALNGVACPVGTFRDTDACYAGGVAPPCTPCTTPGDLVVSEGGLRVSFTSTAVAVDNCTATCVAGYHTVLRANPLVYVSDDVLTLSVWSLDCVPCRFSDTVPCHGVCPPGHFRDRSVALDTTPGACRTCTTNADCAVGHYAPLCQGNGTADVGCLPCHAGLLAGGTRLFVPFSALLTSPDVVRADPSTGFACPTACAINHLLVAGDTCVTCSAFVSTLACSPTDPSPRPCDFIYSHWNATPGPMWYVIYSSSFASP
jgi:hypothetical protein